MFKRVISTLRIGIFGLFHSALAITIINQTDSDKIIKIEEAYRPVADRPGDLAAPISLGYKPVKINIPKRSIQKTSLRATSSVLLVTVINKKKDGKKTTMTENTTCYEPYVCQNQQQEYFNDDWGFVIHKPIAAQYSFTNPNYWDLEVAKKQGYGIKCFDPLLLVKITSLEELPEDLKMHFAGNIPMSTRRS